MAQLLLAEGFATAGLWVAAANTPARCFYAALEGREVGQRSFERDGALVTQIAVGCNNLSPLLPRP
jgi:hypothetical protein